MESFFVAIATTLRIVLAPLWAAPMWIWRRLLAAHPPRWVLGLALVPGCVALVAFVVVAMAGIYPAPPLRTQASDLLAYSPLHQLAHDAMATLMYQTVYPSARTPFVVGFVYAILAAGNALLLAPIYAYVANHERCVAGLR